MVHAGHLRHAGPGHRQAHRHRGGEIKKYFHEVKILIRFKQDIYLIQFRMDENNDGTLTEEEFLKGCLQDDDLSKMLAPNVSG